MPALTDPAALAARLFGPWVRTVGAATLRADLLAGLLGALLVLPQAFAFAALAGLPPQYGLYTAVVPCIVAALFGSSRHVMSGPTNANSLALAATLAPLAVVGSAGYIELALAVTVIVGVMQLLIGGLRLGAIANFISPAALRGFMGGAALLIVFHALTDLLGIAAPRSHGLPVLLEHVAAQLPAVAPAAPAIGLLTVALALALKRWLPRWPQLLLALVGGTLAAALLNQLLNHQLLQPEQGIGRWLQPVAVVGRIPPIWPTLHWPQVEWRSLPDLVGISFALTIVALGQSISIAKAVAERSGQSISANREFVGQGLSNVVGGVFHCYVSCGSLNRSLPNFEAGAKTPLAAVFSALLLLALIAVSSPLLALIPRAGIAGLLLLIAWSLLDWPGWQRLWQASRSDFAIAAATGLATISIRIEMAILLGTILSLVAYLHRTSKPALRTMGFDTAAPGRSMVVLADAAAPSPECPQLKMLRMEGEVYFGAVPWVGAQLRDLRTPHGAPPGVQKHLLVMAKSMNFIDLAAADMWRQELQARRALGGDLYFHRPRPQVLQLWARLGFVQELGADHVFPSKRAAIAAIVPQLDPAICARCTVRLYEECRSLPPPGAETP
jgi:SulP family sulfate permease